MNDFNLDKKNVVLITSSNFPFGGASANYIRLLTTGLVKNKINVHVLLQGRHVFGSYRKVESTKNIFESVTYEYCGFKNNADTLIKKIFDTLMAIIVPTIYLIRRKFGKRIDYVLIYNSWNYQTILTLILCKALRIKIVNFISEFYEKQSIVTSKLKLIKWWDFLFGMHISNKFYTGLVVFSTYLKDFYLNKNFDKSKIMLQPNLIDLSFFESDGTKEIRNHNKIRIGYCGTPTRKDGIDDLLIAFQQLQKKASENELLIIGDATNKNSLIPSLKDKCSKLGIEKNVIFTGLVETREMPDLLNSCDILVLARPSGVFAQAGFPTKLGEYLACKKPVVATRVGDIPLYFEDGKNAMLANPDDPPSIVDKIFYLISNPKIAKEIGESGFKWAKSKLEYVETTEKIAFFLKSL